MRTELPLVSPTPRELASSRTRPGWLRGRRGACPGCRNISAGVGGDTKGHVEIGGTGRQVTLGQKTLYPRGTQLSFLLLGPACRQELRTDTEVALPGGAARWSLAFKEAQHLMPSLHLGPSKSVPNL